jgi:hypothetical protein
MMVSLYYVIQEMHSFSMRPAKYFYDKPLTKYLDSKTVLIYCPHPVDELLVLQGHWTVFIHVHPMVRQMLTPT